MFTIRAVNNDLFPFSDQLHKRVYVLVMLLSEHSVVGPTAPLNVVDSHFLVGLAQLYYLIFILFLVLFF